VEVRARGERKRAGARPMWDYRQHEIRRHASQQLETAGVLALAGHFDYGNGYHGTVSLNVPRLLESPPLTWRLAEDLLDLIPPDLRTRIDTVVGAGTIGVVLAHSIAGLMDGRRLLDSPPCRCVAFEEEAGVWHVDHCSEILNDAHILIVDHWQAPRAMLDPCLQLARSLGGQVVACARIAAWPGEAPAWDGSMVTPCDSMPRDPVPWDNMGLQALRALLV
jgi:hypothetical protein